MNRTALLERLKNETFDLLVIGGGASGAGVALDAATRGLKVALVERLDFSEGTSSRSTKLIHGGVRYLEIAVKTLDRVQLNLVRDALHERSMLLKLAPHLTRPLWLLTPLYKLWEMPYYWTGLKLYDLLAGDARLQVSRYLGPQETLRRFPRVRSEGLVGAVAYQDGQFDDARYNLEVILTALEEGAVAVNYTEVTQLLKKNGKIAGAVVQDRLGGQEFEVGTRVVVNATGPFSDSIRHLDDPAAPELVKASSGVHIVLGPTYSPPDTGLLIPHTEDGRVIFVLPWLGQTLVGTTDDPAEPTPHPRASEEEIAYILRQVEPYLGKVAREEVRAAWAGFRPLVAKPQAADTARLARDHLVQESASGLLTLTGGKWTTYRKMALDCVNYAVRRFGLQAGPSRTHERLLVGGWGFDPNGAQKLAQEYSLEPDIAQHLHRSYGSRASQVAEIGQTFRLAPGYPYIESEVVYAARHELAQTPMDVLARRTRLAFLDTKAAEAALPEVAKLMAKELGWKAEERTAQENQTQERLAVAI
ncbi:MAG: FAD-dependent oxidoreductase [Deinococcota bacterium]